MNSPLAWWLLAAHLMVARTVVYEAFITPSLLTLLGVPYGSWVGPVESYRVDVLDVLLLACAATSALVAATLWLCRFRIKKVTTQ